MARVRTEGLLIFLLSVFTGGAVFRSLAATMESPRFAARGFEICDWKYESGALCDGVGRDWLLSPKRRISFFISFRLAASPSPRSEQVTFSRSCLSESPCRRALPVSSCLRRSQGCRKSYKAW